MITIAIIDWFLTKSDHIKDLISNLRDHKINTRSSFQRVKQKHRDYEAKIREHEARIRELENTIDNLKELEEEPILQKIKVRKQKKKKH